MALAVDGRHLDRVGREGAQAAYGVATAYMKGGSFAVLKQEAACWKKAQPASAEADARDCAVLIVSAGVNDQSMQRQERRGSFPQMDPKVQRARFLEKSRKLGLTTEAAESILGRTSGDLDRIFGGILAAQLERGQSRRSAEQAEPGISSALFDAFTFVSRQLQHAEDERALPSGPACARVT